MVEENHNSENMDRDLTSISEGRIIEGLSPLGSYKDVLSRPMITYLYFCGEIVAV